MADILDQIDRTRAEIDDIKERLDFLENAPLPANEAKAVADRVIERHGRQYLQDRIGYFFHRGYDGDRLLEASDIARGEGTTLNMTPLLLGLFPGLVRERLHALIDERAQTLEAGPPWSRRQTERIELEEQLFDAEIEEERLIEQAEAMGLEVYRRPEASPAAILGIFTDGEEPFPPAEDETADFPTEP